MYSAFLINHRGQPRIGVAFANTTELKNRFRKLTGAQWSQTLKTWHLPDTVEYREKFKIIKNEESGIRNEEKDENVIARNEAISTNTGHPEPTE